MCFRVDCKQCRKYTWSGCGKHLTTLYASIEEGKHCMCRPWPGVKLAIPPPLSGDRNEGASTLNKIPAGAVNNDNAKA
ncbi:hypothetical protein Leryth_007042 [Lithospermum erythrorhizon]|nr:hypothetical protein Leryth_007042 [Lithospermum erythrorhizon]